MRIFVIEGTDGSGKTTQCELLTKNFTVIKFPTEGNSVVNEYLDGKYGCGLNAYAVSSFFALDRYLAISQLPETETIICDRYTTSNFIYGDESIIKWQEQYEYELLGLPRPHGVVFLNMPPKYARKLIDKRGKKKDMYESNKDYMKHVWLRGLRIAREQGWEIVNCVEKRRIKSIERIHSEIFWALHRLGINQRAW